MADRIYGAMLGTMVGVTAGNYLYQWLEHGLWDVAFERSVFQVIALSWAWLAITISRALSSAVAKDGEPT